MKYSVREQIKKDYVVEEDEIREIKRDLKTYTRGLECLSGVNEVSDEDDD